MGSILDRLKEPSTYAGFAAGFAGMGLLDLDEGSWNSIFSGLTILFGGIAAAAKERQSRG